MMKYVKGCEAVKDWATITPPTSYDVWNALPHKTLGYALAIYRHGHGWNIMALVDLDWAVTCCKTLRDMCEQFPDAVGQWHEFSDMVVFATNGTDSRSLQTNWYACGVVVEE